MYTPCGDFVKCPAPSPPSHPTDQHAIQRACLDNCASLIKHPYVAGGGSDAVERSIGFGIPHNRINPTLRIASNVGSDTVYGFLRKLFNVSPTPHCFAIAVTLSMLGRESLNTVRRTFAVATVRRREYRPAGDILNPVRDDTP